MAQTRDVNSPSVAGKRLSPANENDKQQQEDKQQQHNRRLHPVVPDGCLAETSSSKFLKLKKFTAKSSHMNSDSSSASSSSAALDRVAHVLRADGIVALPTDTLYGMGCLAQSTDAVRRIYSVKERHDEKPLSICVGGIRDVFKWAKVHCEEDMLRRLLPGI